MVCYKVLTALISNDHHYLSCQRNGSLTW